ncbi:MAG: LITAF-like zinc ribbon domain-containing protein, partial [Armatimonadota bacterium]
TRGTVHGPYSEDQLAEHLLHGAIGQEWDARFGSGRITKVRDALGPARTDDLLRQMRERLATEVAEQEAHPEDEARFAHVYEDTPTCPNCGGRTVTSEERSANAARIGVIVLGFFFLPIWLLLLVLKDKTRHNCLTCGTQWDESA